jgi:glutaredoxin
MTWLSRWRKKEHSGRLEVVMYTRQDCHLCTDAYSLLEEMRKRFTFTLRVIDVDTQPDLVRIYGDRVPVIVVGEKARLWGKINPALLERLLRAETA